MKFESDKEFTEYVNKLVNEKVEAHFEAMGNQILFELEDKINPDGFTQDQINFIVSLSLNYGKAGAKFGALTALEVTQELQNLD